MANRADVLGAKLGPRMAQLMADATVAARRSLLHVDHDVRVHANKTIIHWMGHEFGNVMAPLTDEILRTKDMPPQVKAALQNMTSGRHQWQALAGMAFGGSGVMNALGTIMNNYLGPLIYETVGKEPVLVPDTGTVTALMARNLIPTGLWSYAMQGQGLNLTWAEAMMEGVRPQPDLGTLTQLLRMGILNATQVEEFLVHAGYAQETALNMIAAQVVPLSVADAALATLRGNMSEADAEHVAHLNGVSVADLQVMIGNTGEPPALEALLQLWRRGAIGDALLERGIRQSRVRDEWIPTVKQLGIQPPTGAEIINSLVTGQIGAGEAQTRWQQAGGDPTWFETAFHTGGESPSPGQLGELANRGVIPWTGTGPTATTYEQGFSESRFKNKWLPYYKQLAVYLPPPRTVSALLNSGAITRDKAQHLLMDVGMPADLAAAYTIESHKVKTAKQRELAITQIETLYMDRAWTRVQAEKAIIGLGYDQADADLILHIADVARERRYTEAVISTVHSRYTHHIIDRSTASTDLDKILASTEERDALLALWDMERSVQIRRLTEAQVIKAKKAGIFTEEEALAKLVEMGYTDADAAVLILL